jgi:hypothetical protein
MSREKRPFNATYRVKQHLRGKPSKRCFMRRDDDVEEDVRTSAFSEGEGYEETEDSTEDLKTRISKTKKMMITLPFAKHGVNNQTANEYSIGYSLARPEVRQC